ncbi:lipid IV(A) 3-deoxy-D-manno-octulosonic acid transferase [Gammaproteobacteria bacterium]|nr:lipid IV(A) 3-deoxy-D-manno-octulosonic acid transferase [Gammaproteobacteria bacterium]
MTKLSRFFYHIFTYLVSPLLILHLILRSASDRRYINRIAERFGFYEKENDKQTIWVHAVSYGEVNAAQTLVSSLLNENPNHQVIFTCTTPTGSALIDELFNDKVINVYLPYDLKGPVKRFFQWAKPKVAIIIETEIWPNIFHYCGRKEIPLILASACISDDSMRKYSFLFSLFKDSVSQGIVVASQTEEDAQKFISLGAKKERTFVTGNLKFDTEINLSSSMGTEVFRNENISKRFSWTAGSTHEGEEVEAIMAHRLIRESIPNALLILAPRKPERFQTVSKILDQSGLSHCKWSESKDKEIKTDVLLVDTLGDLLFFYSVSKVSFVGGSLFDIGGHNLIEPAILMKPILTGPKLDNVHEIADQFKLNQAIIIVRDHKDIANSILELVDDNKKCIKMTNNAKTIIERNKGSREQILQLIRPLLDLH